MIIKDTILIVTSKYTDTPFLLAHEPAADDDYYNILERQEIEIEFDMPSDIELRNMKIDKLKAKKVRVQADAEISVEKINTEIQSLMALEAQ